MKKETAIAIDNVDLREQNQKKIVDGLHEMGQYAKDLRKGAKLSMWLSIGLVALLISSLAAAFYVGGFDGLIDLRTSKRSFVCEAPKFNDTVRSYTDARGFVELYGGACALKIRGEDTDNADYQNTRGRT